MAGFYAARLGIFKEAETESDPNVIPGPAENPEGATEQPTQQDAQSAAEQPQEGQEQQAQENTEANPDQNQQQPPEEDPTADMIPNEDPEDAGGDPNGGGDPNQPQGAGTTQPGEPSPVDGIKKKEEEILANLTPEELDIKHKELKTQFLAMFDTTTELIERINNISLDPEDIPVVEYASNNLSVLRTMLKDYMDSVYKTKSYTENYVNYNRFLATLNGINKILEEINKNED